MDIHYNAFISYRHHPDDIRVASEIHRLLEHYKVPRAIRKQSKGITRLFRDKEELPITSNLTDDITRALENSDYLIVICSTHTRESTWVQREIETFLKTHDRSKILTVLVNGEPYETIPEILLSEERVNPITGQIEQVPIEPLSCDWRMPRRKAKREELPRLAAALLNCGYNELRQRERQYRMQRMIAAFSTALAISLCFMGYFIYSNLQIQQANERLQDANERIQENLDQALKNQSMFLGNESLQLLDDGDRLTAIALALEALPEYEGERPYVATAELALSNAVGAYQANGEVMADGAFNCDAVISSFQLTDDGSTIYIADQREMVTIWDTKTYRQLASVDLGYSVYRHDVTASGNLLAEGFIDNTLSCVAPDGTVLWRTQACNDMAFLDNKSVLMLYSYIYTDNGYVNTIFFLDPDTGADVRDPIEVPDPTGHNGYITFLQDNYDSNSPLTVSFSFSSGYNVAAIDLQTEECHLLTTDKYIVECSAVTSEGNILVMSTQQNNIYTGSFYDRLLTSQTDWEILCFDGQTYEHLWTTPITSYLYGDCMTLQTIPGSSNIMCQIDNIFNVIDSATGEVLTKCETTSIPIFVDVYDTYTFAILRDGSACTYTYDTNICGTIRYFTEDLIQADANHGIYVRPYYGTQIVTYTTKSDENWTKYDGTYDLVVKNQASYGNLLAIESYSEIFMFDTEKGTLLWSEESGYSFGNAILGFTADGSSLIVTSDHAVFAYNPQTGTSKKLPLPLISDGYDLVKPRNFYFKDDMLFYDAKNYVTGDLLCFYWNLETEAFQYWNLGPAAEPDTDDWFYQETVTLTASDSHALVWENSTQNVYRLDLATGDMELFTVDVETRPVMQVLGDGSYIALAPDTRFLLANWDGEVLWEVELGEKKAVAFCYRDDALFALCDDGFIYRFDKTGKQLSHTGLNLYSDFYTDITSSEYDPGTIDWIFTDDGDLIINVFQSGNIIDCSTWERRAFVPYMVSYNPNLDEFVTVNTDTTPYGLGSCPRYSTEDIMAMAKEALNGFELSGDQKSAYGLSEDD